ncbi:glycosyltransferase family 4 protein [Parvularcula dongshanensis]|uniref:UDP-N-acetylmuramyl pentapeptide phosphotransferase/UDP-N-acetylglucosamine-1-phosphate transferase n=1 Tax=Parvularcula dongshanensis TaxID=1173995 RepID=A0A840I6Z2_9PROT|nr:hypothetical protein [Parvularcula dongshanensis]MBB4660031.1 UDP-N-acetylmuramyl pentapeptide phosphotransferase/UDP-N-acetylglucosamine-1-phosphate transferase [Parvularcula dongshanensis]
MDRFSILIAALAVLPGALAYAFCGLVARWHVLSDPVSERSNHVAPTSRAGGAVVMAVLSLSGAAVVFLLPGQRATLVLLGFSGAAALLGLLDDAHALPPVPKLVVLLSVSIGAALAVGGVPGLPLGIAWLPLPAFLGLPIAVLWIFGFANVFNFLDGLNGMAAGTGIVLLVGLGLVSDEQGLLFLAGASALLGFAWRNIGQGAPFLGDAGSLGLGTLIAAGALQSAGPRDPLPLFLIAAAALPFVADAAVTMAQRFRAGAALMTAHSEHAYQRLRRAGHSHDVVSLTYTALAAIVLALGLALRGLDAWLPIPLALLSLVLWTVAVRRLFRSAAYADRTKEESANPSSVSRSGEGGRTDKASAAASA